MMTVTIAAAAAAVAHPTLPPAATSAAQNEHMQMRHSGEHEGMACCKHCCKDMAAMREGHASDRSEHSAQ